MSIQVREVRKRLLNLFPRATLLGFPQARKTRTKADAISAVADGADLDDVRGFVSSKFGCLHQHVHMFERGRSSNHALRIGELFGVRPFSERMDGDEHHHFYLIPLHYDLVLDEPLERRVVTFAWPVKVVVAPQHARIHFTIMAKSLQAYIRGDRVVMKSVQKPKTHDLLNDFRYFAGRPLDFNRGIKALWRDDEFDARKVQYKRARATSLEVMDERFTVRRHDPDRYAELANKQLYKTTFEFSGENPCIKYFVADPTQGTLAFRRFSSFSYCIDDVIRRLLAAN